jgi:thiol-disulfide isomerase/thioredoxin
MKVLLLTIFLLFSFSLPAQEGPTVGSKLRSLSGKDMITGKLLDIEFSNSPAYTLFHFWQSGSDSCAKEFSALEKFVQQYKAKLVAYGFPYEFKQTIPEAKELIAKHKLNWAQLLQYRQAGAAGSNVIDVLVIKEFPTYILLDRDGVILVRSNDLDDVEALLVKIK